ncbi:MAG TPA: tetratricopeptide repeat protein, partial [Polyangiaceae bacterium]
MLIETLSAELERLFELPDLTRLSMDALGFAPSELAQGDPTRASFARALAEKVIAIDAVDALLDAIALEPRGLTGPLEALHKERIRPVELAGGDAVGDYLITAQIAVGPWASIYTARQGGQEYRLKIVHPRVAARRSEVQRYLTHTRLASQVEHKGLPTELSVLDANGNGGHFGTAQLALEGETLAAMLEKKGARHFNEVLPFLWAIGEALGALHEARLVHGSLHLGNVLVVDPTPAAPHVVLLDAGSHRLRSAVGSSQTVGIPHWLAASSPEQLRGEEPDPRADVYALGVLIYQLVSGKAPFGGTHAVEALLGHLTQNAEPLSFVAAGNGATAPVETFVRSLLDKQRDARPSDANEAMEGLRRLWRASTRPPTWVTEERMPEFFAALTQNPTDENAAAQLEGSVDLGADPKKLADGFFEVARSLHGHHEPALAHAMKKHLARAARLYETASDHDTAEQVYSGLVKLDPSDRAASQALTRIKKTLGKYEELIEALLEQSESSESSSERAEHWSEIGALYENELKDKDQALLAYAQAFCEDPQSEQYSLSIERLAGTRYQAWEDVLGRTLEAVEKDVGAADKHALLFHMGRWYAEKVARPDLALPWLTQLVAAEPNHDRALAALASIYKKAQQWAEFGQTLLKRADVAAPNVSRDLRVEAADVLVSRLSSADAAREIFRGVLDEDPGHARAAEGLIKLLEAAGDNAEAVSVREKRANTLKGDDRWVLLCEVAEGYEVDLDRLDMAEKIYRQVLTENSRWVDALRGLDRVLTRAGRYRELLEVLRMQVDLGVTARQKIALYERIAGIYDEEYLDHEKAAAALEAILELDSGHLDAGRELARHYRALENYSALAKLYGQQAENGTVERRIEAGLLLGRVLAENLKITDRAIAAYEAVLELSPGHSGALDALATLRTVVGDAESALAAIEELSANASSPEAKAELEVRAAQVFEKRGDLAGALRRYKLAAELTPDDPAAQRRLVEKYVATGNHAAAVELLEEQISETKAERSRAELAGQMALICYKHLDDPARASATAQLALHLDAANVDGLRVLGQIAYSEKRYVEAAKRLEAVVTQGGASDDEDARDVAFAYIDALARGGSTDKAIGAIGNLMNRFAGDARSLLRLVDVAGEHGSPEQTLWLCEQLLTDELRAGLLPLQEAQAELRLGGALAALKRGEEAQAALNRALDLDPDASEALKILAKLFVDEGQPRKAMDVLYRELSLSLGDRKVEILLEMGDMAVQKLDDPDYAGKSYLLALSERPNDRTILTKL